MTSWNRSLKAAAAGALFLGLWASALAAQDTNTVGPPQLKNFQLPGQQTTAPAPAPPPAPVPTVQPPPPTIQRPAATSPATTAAPPRANPAQSAPVPRPGARNAPNPRARAAAPPPAAAPPSAQPAPTAAPAETRAAPAPPVAPAPPPAAPAQPASPFPWLWVAIPAGAVLIGLLAFAWLRRRRAVEDRHAGHRGALAGALFAGETEAEPQAEGELVLDVPVEPIPAETASVAAQPEPSAETAAEAPRPWLDLDIRPDRAAATDTEAVVHYQLQVTNVGDAPARNIRIDTRMFNASEAEGLDSFLRGAIHRHSGSPHVALPPGESLRLDASTAMKKEDVRAIELAGRSIFVPTVAINVAYDWGEDGEGRTSRSWVVGRESNEPAAKMGPFRLDLGPRIYRSVGRRDALRVMV